MPRHKSFGGSAPKLEDFQPINFTLVDEEFECKPALQGAVLLNFVAEADSKDGGRSAAAMMSFFKDVMEKPEYERFNEFVMDGPNVIDIETLGEITSWLVESYSERPTKRPTRSARGPKTDGTTSTDGVSSTESD